MGHMTQIANRLHRAQEIRQEVAEFVQDDSQWQDYCTTHLATCNEVWFPSNLDVLCICRCGLHNIADCVR